MFLLFLGTLLIYSATLVSDQWSHMTSKTPPPHWWWRRRWRRGWSRWRRTGGWATCWWRWPPSSSSADKQMSPSASFLRLLIYGYHNFSTQKYFVKSFTRQPEFTISYSFWVALIHWRPLWVADFLDDDKGLFNIQIYVHSSLLWMKEHIFRRIIKERRFHIFTNANMAPFSVCQFLVSNHLSVQRFIGCIPIAEYKQ